MREKITVLIADDNQEFSMTLATYLKNQEDMVVVGRAKDGNEALDMITSLMPDVVLMDVIMPHLDGIGVLEKINTIHMNKRPISIMLSAVVALDSLCETKIEVLPSVSFSNCWKICCSAIASREAVGSSKIIIGESL